MIVMALGQLSTENIILRIVLTSMLEFLSFCLFGFVGTLTPFLRRVKLHKLLIPLKLPFLAVRELLILVLKYCYGCTVIIPKDKDKMGYERYWQR